MGRYRYYMAPVGIISVEEVPANWGLVEIVETGKRQVMLLKKVSLPFIEWNTKAESSFLVSLFRRTRLQPGKHIAIKAYVIESHKEPRATVTLVEEGPEHICSPVSATDSTCVVCGYDIEDKGEWP